MADQLLSSPLQKGPESSHLFACSSNKPMGPLESFVNSLELSNVKAKISRTVAALPLFCDSPEDTSDDDNDTTLNDEDAWLSSPTQKRKLLGPRVSCSPTLESFPELFFSSNDHLSKTSLRSFNVPHDVIPRIDIGELHKIVSGEYVNQFDDVVIVDCRFPYEYEGGHIENAINISLHSLLEKRFILDNPSEENNKTLLVFHCEYSLLRGPTMAAHLRKLDRIHNENRYPQLTYPDVVVLEGGYKSFFDKYTHLCEPQGYVEMKDTKHKKVCDIEMNKVLQASKLIRAKSFNIAKPIQPSVHTRSVSLTAVLTTAETQSTPSLSGPPSLHRSRSTKVHKRERKDSRPLFTQSLYNLPTSIQSEDKTVNGNNNSNNNNSISSIFNIHSNEDYNISEGDTGIDFQPPPAVFRYLDKSLSALLLSMHLPLGSVYSAASFSSTDSLMDAPSPFTDTLDDFDLALLPSKGLSSMSDRPGFPRPRLSLARSSTRGYIPLLVSPTVTSPFFSSGSGVDDLCDESFLTAEPF